MPAAAPRARRFRHAFAPGWVAAVLAALASPVAAQDHEAGSAVVRADAMASDVLRVESGAGAATAVDTRIRGPQAESLADLLGEVPGLHVRRQGDGFSPQTVSLRGAPASQVTVALDGVVLNDAASDGVDLSLLPPALIERVDVYRGNAPLRLGSGALGGAVEVISRRLPTHPTGQVTLGGGSFGSWRGSALSGGRSGRMSVLAAVGTRGTQGDFSFYDTAGTPLDPGTVSDRSNNRAQSADGLYRLCYALDDRTAACALAVATWRSREIAGTAGFPTLGPYTESGRLVVRAGLSHRGTGVRTEGFLATVVRADHVANRGAVPLDGVPSDVRATTWSLEAGGTLEARTGRVVVRGSARLRAERYVPHGTGHEDNADRQGTLATLETALALGPLTVTPGAGVEALADHGPAGSGARTLASPRVGVGAVLTPWLTLRGTAGHAERAPTLPELYGDRGVIVGNALLRPETADTVDGGLVVSAATRSVRVRWEATGYLRRVRDLITLVQTSRQGFEPYNLDRATVTGLESAVRVAWAHRLRITGAYALVDARTPPPSGPDRRVPGIPVHDLYGRVDVQLGPVAVGADATYVSDAYIDVGNTAPIPARWLLGLSADVDIPGARWLSVHGAVTNLLDSRTGTVPFVCGTAGSSLCEATAPIQDFLGYPLPGRAVFVSVTARTEAVP